MGALQVVAIDWALLGLPILLSLVAGGYVVRARSRRSERDAELFEEGRKSAMPNTLHPVIDRNKCIGCTSCMTACPEGDIIGLVDGRAALLDASACIGHGRCALECPLGAIRLVFGTEERGVDLPQLDSSFESSRPGVHVVGELGGMGLIKNAITQGLEVAEVLSESLTARAARGQVDVVVVGAGPAGLATALGLKEAGLRARLVDQEPTFGGTIAHYPRQKVVMTERVHLPGYGRFGKSELSKEELLALWQDVIDRAALEVECGVRVSGLEGRDGDFTLQTSKGPIRARKVVLATGRRGTPRRLGVKGESLPKVAYRLIDAEQYRGKKVLVVGGGDAALEAAIALAEQPGVKVTLAHRGPSVSKARTANKQRFAAMVAQKRVTALFSTVVAEVRPREVVLASGGASHRLGNDYVLACTGGELPVEFLGRAGVELASYFGSAPALAQEAKEAAAPKQGKVRGSSRLPWVLAGVAAAVLLGLAAVGHDYYLLDKAGRKAHAAHAWLKPSGAWGHGVGIVASLLILSNFAYSVRKRVRALKGTASIKRWLTFHQFAGALGSLMILFHAAFKTNNVLATLTSAVLALLVLTGVLGRFVYGLVPLHGSELVDVQRRWARLRARVEALMQNATDALEVQPLLARVAALPAPGWSQLVALPAERLAVRRALTRIKLLLPAGGDDEALFFAFERLWRLKVQACLFGALKKAFATWWLVHVVLAIALVLLLAAHVAVSLALGYHWIAS
jgi:dihydropyrimidine dehydrogenase (NAD+) subunit PreT